MDDDDRPSGAVMEAEPASEANTEICPDARGQVFTGATPIDIGGVTVPLGELLASRHRRCPHCSGGWVHRSLPDGRKHSAICGCCVQGWRAERARRAPTPATGVAVVSLAWQEKARQRVAHLERDVAALEADRAEKVRRFDEDNAELLASAKSAAASAHDEATLGLKATAEVECLQREVAEAETHLALLKAALAGREEKQRAHAEARALAEAMQADAEREIERRRDGLNLDRLDRDLAKARRRLAALRIYTAGGPCSASDAPAATEAP